MISRGGRGGGSAALGAVVLLLAWWLRAPALAAALALLCGIPACIGWLAARPQLVDYAAVPLLVALWGVAVTARPGVGAAVTAGPGPEAAVTSRARAGVAVTVRPGVGAAGYCPARAGVAVAVRSGVEAPARTAVRIAAVCGVAVLQAAWVNLHAAATLGVGLTVLASLGWLLSSWRDLRPGRAWRDLRPGRAWRDLRRTRAWRDLPRPAAWLAKWRHVLRPGSPCWSRSWR